MRSASPQTSSAVSSTVAPDFSNSWSVMELPSPAPCSTSTRWPASVSSRTPTGVIATLYSWSLSSRGMPTSMVAAFRSSRPHRRARARQVYETGRGGSGRPAGRPAGRGVRRGPVRLVGCPRPGQLEPVQAERDQGLGVPRRAGGPRQRLLEGQAHHLDALLLPVGRRGVALDRPDALGQVQVEHLVAPPRGGVEGGQEGEAAALDPQLLGQLAAERVLDRLAVDVVLARRHLQHPGPGGVAPLVDQHHLAVVVDHQGADGPVVLDHLALAGAAVVVDDPVGPDREHLALEGPAAVDDPERRGLGHRGAPPRAPRTPPCPPGHPSGVPRTPPWLTVARARRRGPARRAPKGCRRRGGPGRPDRRRAGRRRGAGWRRRWGPAGRPARRPAGRAPPGPGRARHRCGGPGPYRTGRRAPASPPRPTGRGRRRTRWPRPRSRGTAGAAGSGGSGTRGGTGRPRTTGGRAARSSRPGGRRARSRRRPGRRPPAGGGSGCGPR